MHLAIDNPDLPNENRLIENCELFNVAAWNVALINAVENSQLSIINSFLKKIITNENEKLVHLRVLSWIHYYQNEFSEAINSSKEILRQCDITAYIYKDVTEDLRLFRNSIK